MMTATVATADLLEAVAARRAGESEDAGAAYSALARRLAAGRPARSDTPEAVDRALAAAGRELSDLRRDVRALEALDDARAGLRLLVEAEGRAAVAGFKLSTAAHEERVGVIKLREARQAASNAVTFAGRDVERLAAKVAPLLSLVPDVLRERFQAARGAWNRADLALREARAAAGGWRLREPLGTSSGSPDVAHGPEELARLEADAIAAHAAVLEAVEALAAHEPDLSALEAAGLRPAVVAAPAPVVEAAAQVEADEQHAAVEAVDALDEGEDLADEQHGDERHEAEDEDEQGADDDADEQGSTGGAA